MEHGKGDHLQKLLDFPHLLEEVRSLKHNGQKIVFTNGCFDLIHPGHIAYLQAARQMGWGLVPMMCAREIPVPGSLRRVIRVLVHWNTELPQNAITHVYLREAVKLRPDLVAAQ